MKKLKYILVGITIVILLVFLVSIIIIFSKDKEQKDAISQTEHYLAENYQGMKYKLQNISTSTDFKHYGYYKYAITVQNMDTKEKFIVYYDKKMNLMEDSIHIEKQEKRLKETIEPKIRKYIKEQFGETRYITVSYDIELGKPLIVVTFNKEHADITQSDFDTFITYLKETIGLEHANVIVDYWTEDLTFNKEY